MTKVNFKWRRVNRNYFIKNYDLVWTNLFNNEQTIIIDDKNDTCRFCGKTKKEVKFTNKCHAVPEFLGNKTIITKNECDNCNHKYANLLEDELSKFTLPTRLMTRVYGKTGIPKYKNNNSRMEFSNIFKINATEEFLKIDEQNKNIELKFKVQTFTPIKAYKALVRIALNCLPKKYFDKFKNIEWLENDEDLNWATGLYTTIINEFFPIMPPSLFVRKKDKIKVPYCQMVLQFNNNFIQVIIPFLEQDKQLSKFKEINIYPFYIFKKKQKNIKINLIGLSSKEKEKLSYNCSFKYYNKKETI
mgnify:CR=1 FL=1